MPPILFIPLLLFRKKVIVNIHIWLEFLRKVFQTLLVFTASIMILTKLGSTGTMHHAFLDLAIVLLIQLVIVSKVFSHDKSTGSLDILAQIILLIFSGVGLKSSIQIIRCKWGAPLIWNSHLQNKPSAIKDLISLPVSPRKPYTQH